jgi:hypothetical protein
VNISVDTRTNTILPGGEPETGASTQPGRQPTGSQGGNTDDLFSMQADEMLAILKGTATPCRPPASRRRRR